MNREIIKLLDSSVVVTDDAGHLIKRNVDGDVANAKILLIENEIEETKNSIEYHEENLKRIANDLRVRSHMLGKGAFSGLFLGFSFDVTFFLQGITSVPVIALTTLLPTLFGLGIGAIIKSECKNLNIMKNGDEKSIDRDREKLEILESRLVNEKEKQHGLGSDKLPQNEIIDLDKNRIAIISGLYDTEENTKDMLTNDDGPSLTFRLKHRR